MPFLLRVFLNLVFIAGFMGLSISVQAKEISKKNEIMFYIYKGEPPAGFHYKVLGVVHGKYKGDSFLTSKEEIFRSISKEIIAKAKHMGANAIINRKFMRLGENIYTLEGEAVLVSQ